ncbi:MAG: hypothetical protein ACXVPQ_05325 [Bacteroidia bacterium]
MSAISKIEQMADKLKHELSNPKLNSVKKTYLLEKIKLLGEYAVKKQK